MFTFILQRILDKNSSGAKVEGSSRNLSSYFILTDTELLFQYECSQRNMKIMFSFENMVQRLYDTVGNNDTNLYIIIRVIWLTSADQV